jgi:pimeloyl-ACP methyl ester carboxylesterase
LALLDALAVSSAAVVGHSFGARAAVDLALLAPDRVSALVVVDGALSLPDDRPAVPSWLGALLGSGPLLEAVVSATATNPLATRSILAAFMAHPDSAKPDYVALYQRPQSLRGSTAALALWLPHLALPWKAPDYARLSAPTLLLWGEADRTTPLSLAESLKALIPGSRLVALPKSGHMLPLEDPAGFNAALLDFLAAR